MRGGIRRTHAVAEARLAEAGGFCVVGGRLSATQAQGGQ